MPNIESLTAQADRLEKSFSHWNHAYLVLVAVTAFFVFLTFVAQWVASGKSGELDAARKAVISAKDGQLAEEFAHRDERIAKVKADADVSIAEVEAEADDKIFRAKQLAEQIGIDSNRKTEKLRAQNLETAAKLVAAEKSLEEERIARAEVEKSVAARRIYSVQSGGKYNFDVLKPYAGTKFIIQTVPDWEARRAAANIAGILTGAGWTLDKAEVVDDNIEDGVSIQSYRAPARDSSNPKEYEKMVWADMGVESRSRYVAQQLEKFLTESNWQAEAHTALFVEGPLFPPDTIRIKVGLKPSPNDLNPMVQEINKKSIELKKKLDHEFPSKRPEE
jgi:hypothetical protein